MIDGLKFHHIGYAVKDIDLTSSMYLSAGWNISETIIDTTQNAKIAFLKKDGMPDIELVAPVDKNSPVNKTIEKAGITPYHICYETDDINSAIAELRKKKFIVLFKPVAAPAIDNKLISYLFHKDVGLVELVQSK